MTNTPMIKSKVKKYFGKKLYQGTIKPEEAVVAGAAIQGAIINGNNVWKELSMSIVSDIAANIVVAGVNQIL